MPRFRVVWAAPPLAAAAIAILVATHQPLLPILERPKLTASTACTVSGATGGGTPSSTMQVGAPVANGGNSSTEIQNALNGATPGTEVELQAGTYTIDSPIIIPSGVIFSGAGESMSTLLAGAQMDSVVETGGHSNLTVQDMTLNQNGTNVQSSRSLDHYLVDLGGGSNVLVQQVHSMDPSTYSIGPHAGISHFCLLDDDIEVDPMTGKYSYVNLDGIHVTNGSFGDIVNNYIDGQANGAAGGDDAIALQVESGAGADTGNTHDINVTGNVVRGGATAEDLDFAMGGPSLSEYNIAVSGNEFWGGPEGIRTGNFQSPNTSQLYAVSITNNIIHNNGPDHGLNKGLPGGAVDLGNSGSSGINISGITVMGNYTCGNAENPPIVVHGSDNTVSDNAGYTGCRDAPSTTTPPPPPYPPGSGAGTTTMTQVPGLVIAGGGQPSRLAGPVGPGQGRPFAGGRGACRARPRQSGASACSVPPAGELAAAGMPSAAACRSWCAPADGSPARRQARLTRWLNVSADRPV